MLAKIFSQVQKVNEPAPSYPVVGIDLGSSSLKVVELHERDGIITLTNYAEMQLSTYGDKASGQVTQLDQKTKQTAVSDVMVQTATKAKQAMYTIPLTSSFLTTFSLPNVLETDDLAALVRVEARKYIPIPMTKVTLDWLDLTPEPEKKNKANVPERHILIAAIQNESIEQAQNLLTVSGLSNSQIEIEAFSTIRGCDETKYTNHAVVDIGAQSTKLYIVKDGVLQRSHRILGGSAQCTETFAKEKGLSVEEAEYIKKNLPDQGEEKDLYQKIFRQTFSRIVKELHQVIREHSEKFGVKLEAVVLTGGGVLFLPLQQIFASELDIPVHVAKPFERVAYPAFMEDTLKVIGPSYSTALGAALRQFE